MSRLQDKLAKALQSQHYAEDRVEHIEAKIRRANFKKDRKQFRKKMQTDPTLRLLIRMERQMFEGELLGPEVAIQSLLEQINKPLP